MRCLLIVITLLQIFPALSSISAQQVITGNLQEYIEAIIAGMPGPSGNHFTNLSPTQEEDWRDLFQLLSEENYPAAAAAAPGLQYQLIRFLDNTNSGEKEYYLLEKEEDGSHYWGTYIFNPDACRKLVIQCPHPRYDSNTGAQGIFVFRNMDAYAYFLTGTHRCNHLSPSGCSGSTSACGTSAPYRRADVAHNILSGFHLATEVLYDQIPALYFVQLHGFGKRDTDPYVIMSTAGREIPEPDLAAAIRDGLLTADSGLTFKISHFDLDWTRLFAFTNTQGRYINGSTDPCTENADTGNGHFIHIEQEINRLRSGPEAWKKMEIALSSAFSCTTVPVQDPVSSSSTFWKLLPDGSLKFNLPPGQVYELRLYNWLGQSLGRYRIDANETFTSSRGGGVFIVWGDGKVVTSGKLLVPGDYR